MNAKTKSTRGRQIPAPTRMASGTSRTKSAPVSNRERDKLVATALEEGLIAASEVGAVQQAYVQDAAATRQMLASLSPGLKPKPGEVSALASALRSGDATKVSSEVAAARKRRQATLAASANSYGRSAAASSPAASASAVAGANEQHPAVAEALRVFTRGTVTGRLIETQFGDGAAGAQRYQAAKRRARITGRQPRELAAVQEAEVRVRQQDADRRAAERQAKDEVTKARTAAYNAESRAKRREKSRGLQ